MFIIFIWRTMAQEHGLEKVAAQLKKYNISGLLVIGGFDVSCCFLMWEGQKRSCWRNDSVIFFDIGYCWLLYFI